MNIKIFPICALAAMILSSCGSNAGQQAGAGAQSAEEVLPVVKVLVTSKQNVPQVQTYSSTVQANIINNIAPQTGGRIQKIRAEIGDFVSAGQILAEMDRVQLDQALLRLKNAEDELARIKTLFEEGGVSQSDYESMELSYKVAKSSCDNLEENTILRSPINGVVTARNYDKGDMYTMAQPLFTVTCNLQLQTLNIDQSFDQNLQSFFRMDTTHKEQIFRILPFRLHFDWRGVDTIWHHYYIIIPAKRLDMLTLLLGCRHYHIGILYRPLLVQPHCRQLLCPVIARYYPRLEHTMRSQEN